MRGVRDTLLVYSLWSLGCLPGGPLAKRAPSARTVASNRSPGTVGMTISRSMPTSVARSTS